jgi:flagellar biosynthesis chaperone FliJ
MLSERGLVLAGSRRGAMRQTLAVENLAGLEDQARSDWTDARVREQGLSKLHERLQAVEEAENLRLEQIESDDVEVRRRLS